MYSKDVIIILVDEDSGEAKVRFTKKFSKRSPLFQTDILQDIIPELEQRRLRALNKSRG